MVHVVQVVRHSCVLIAVVLPFGCQVGRFGYRAHLAILRIVTQPRRRNVAFVENLGWVELLVNRIAYVNVSVGRAIYD